jgi:RNA polymerase sigma-70 factor (ECF subfamily)
MDSQKDIQPDSQEERFMVLFSINKRKIYAYILAALGNRNVADDIMQQTLLTMWRNFSRFEEGTNFAAWGKTIAKYRIFSYRRKQAKEMLLGDEALQRVLDLSQSVEMRSDERQRAMEGCLKKLSDQHLKLIQLRYNQEYTCTLISEKLNRPISTVYKTLARIHASLHDCILRTLRVWEAEA